MYEWMESLTVCMWKDKCGGCREVIWIILLSIEIRSSDAFGSLKSGMLLRPKSRIDSQINLRNVFEVDFH